MPGQVGGCVCVCVCVCVGGGVGCVCVGGCGVECVGGGVWVCVCVCVFPFFIFLFDIRPYFLYCIFVDINLLTEVSNFCISLIGQIIKKILSTLLFQMENSLYNIL